MKLRNYLLLLVLAAFAFIACDTVTEPEEEEEGGGGSGGGGGTVYRRIREINATIYANNTQTSGPIGGVQINIDSQRFNCSGNTNSQGVVIFHKECNFAIYSEDEVEVDISASAAGFNPVSITGLMFTVTELETEPDVIWCALNFEYTVNMSPSP